jgi:hypothetical protein
MKAHSPLSTYRSERVDFRPNAVFIKTPVGFVGYSGYRLTMAQKIVHWIKTVFKD